MASVTAQERRALGVDDESDLTPLEDEGEAPQTRKSRSPRKNAAVDQVPRVEGRAKRSNPKNTPRARKQTMSQVENSTVTDLEALPKKRKRASKPAYSIPDVERKVTTFRGRLGMNFVCCVFSMRIISSIGYACLNTVLRNNKPASEAVFCSRTCRSVIQ